MAEQDRINQLIFHTRILKKIYNTLAVIWLKITDYSLFVFWKTTKNST
jgi:hypothetical protein